MARLWGLRKKRNNMNYDKLSRALRYYYDKVSFICMINFEFKAVLSGDLIIPLKSSEEYINEQFSQL